MTFTGPSVAGVGEETFSPAGDAGGSIPDLPRAAASDETGGRAREKKSGEPKRFPEKKNEITTTRARAAPSAMSDDAPRNGVETRARTTNRKLDVQAGVAIPGLPFEVVVTHVLREENLPDPADLAHLRGVSRGMRDAVDATGRRIKELDEYTALDLGYVTTLRCLQRRGRLSRKEFLCHAAARSGQLEELKALRAESCPWTVYTCQAAATGGHLEVLQWARANGCTWNNHTCAVAAEGGHLNVLQWARENGCPWDEETCTGAAKSGHLEVLQWARLNGCPWGESTCDGAVVGGHLKLMLWAHANGCPWKGGRARNWRQRTDTLR